MEKEDTRKRVRTTLKKEQAALESLARRTINDGFWEAVELLRGRRGKIVTTGVGKSGFVAMKMAATLTSLGHQAIFLNPLDALHGDSGLVSKGDVGILLSFSGEAKELVKLAKHFKKSSATKMVSVTGKRTSTLAKLGDASIVLSVSEEGCPLGLAPMASTTASMVVGDLLASALTEPKQFGADHFSRFHPAGNLGLSTRRVKEEMARGTALPKIASRRPFEEALREISKKKRGIVGVVEKGKLVGSISDGDIRRIVLKHNKPRELPVRSVMQPKPKAISQNASLGDALAEMERHKITSLFVLDDSARYVGLIHMHDIVEDIV